MKLTELREWRDRAARGVGLRGNRKEWRIIISMGTIGIAAGAREIMHIIMDDIERNNLDNVEVAVTGSLGIDHAEPMLEIKHGDQRWCYGHLDTDAAHKIISDHVLQGHILERYIIGLPKENE
ncbi:MAG TPA: (2Fe-2S) ferredoxin domain-containing protein [Armatimonadota bacterium]|nr:(2Fe-2S) ferredoxin domain-containing protein [Armatimonadota bacterium]